MRQTLIKVCQNLFVGSQNDEVAIRRQSGWFVIHTCKEPYHRQALGYTTPGAPKNHPEYLVAARPSRLILNLVDVDKVSFIAPEIVYAALASIRENIESTRVLVHCNRGMSWSPAGYRAPVSAEVLKHTDVLGTKKHAQAVQAFEALYPSYAPAKGMADYVLLNWEKYLPAS